MDGKLRHGGPNAEPDNFGGDAEFGESFFDQTGSLVDMAFIRPGGLLVKEQVQGRETFGTRLGCDRFFVVFFGDFEVFRASKILLC